MEYAPIVGEPAKLPFSTAFDTLSATVVPNRRPVLSASSLLQLFPVPGKVGQARDGEIGKSTLVRDLIGGSITDPDAGDPRGIAITAVASGLDLYTSTNNGWSWTKATGLTPTSALTLLADNSTRVLLVDPKRLNAPRTVSAALTLVAWDGSGGFTNGKTGVNTTSDSTAGSPFSSSSRSADLQLQQINTAPNFDPAGGSLAGGNLAGGRAALDLGFNSADSATSAVIQADGKILLAGFTDAQPDGGIGTGLNIGVVRLKADGSLDTSFGTNGNVLLDFGADSSDYDCSVLTQADGKILLAGKTTAQPAEGAGKSFNYGVLRLNSNGSLDASFGAKGRAQIDLGFDSVDKFSSAVIQADGKILIVGDTTAQPPGITGRSLNFGIVRLKADGSLDTGFGINGKALLDLGSNSIDVATSVVTQADGKILIAGYTDASRPGITETTYNFCVVRLDARGSLDTSFGANGKVLLDLGADSGDFAYSVVTQADGKILLAGKTTAKPPEGSARVSFNYGVVRLNADGSLDPSFGASGKALIDLGSNSNDEPCSLSIQSDGRILISGSTDAQPSGAKGQLNNYGVVRLNVDGSLDTSFGASGKALIDIGFDSPDFAASAVIQSDGRLLLLGSTFQRPGGIGNSWNYGVVRLNADGSFDTTFPRSSTLDGKANYLTGAPAVALDNDVLLTDPDLATLNGGAGNYAGARLVLQRDGGASADDRFAGLGKLQLEAPAAAGKPGRVLLGTTTVNTTALPIGSYTQAGGKLEILFNNNTTQAVLNEAASSLGYTFNGASAPVGPVQISWQFFDGNSGGQGDGGEQAVSGTTQVTITAPPVDRTSSATLLSTTTVPLPTTANSAATAVTVLELRLADNDANADGVPNGGTSDGLPTEVKSISVSLANPGSASLSYQLRGPDLVTPVAGVLSSDGTTLNFDLGANPLSIANNSSETYSIEAWYSGGPVTDGANLVSLSLDPLKQISLALTGSLFNTTSPVQNRQVTGDVVATTLNVLAPDTKVVSGKAMTFTVQAVDANGNLDKQAGGSVTLELASGNGTLQQVGRTGNPTATFSNGVAYFDNVVYAAAGDGESFTLKATGGVSGVSSPIVADVRATMLQFQGQAVPGKVRSGEAAALTGLGLVGVDADGRIDRDLLAANRQVQLSLQTPGGSLTGLGRATGDTDSNPLTITLNAGTIDSNGRIDLGSLQLVYTNANGSNQDTLALKADLLGGTLPSALGTSFSSIAVPNSPPSLSLGSATAPAWTENGGVANATAGTGPVAVAPGAVLGDTQQNTLQSLTVALTNLKAGDLLELPAQVATSIGLTAGYDASSGVLQISGPATLANYQAALRAVTFSNTSDNPDSTTRNLTVTANDGQSENAVSSVSLSLTVAAANDKPFLNGITALNATEDTFAALDLSGFTFGDFDSGATPVSLTVTAAQGALSAKDGAGVTVTQGGNPGEMVLQGTAGRINAFLLTPGTIQYLPASQTHDAVSLSFSADDGTGAVSLGSTTINVAAVSDEAVFNGLPAGGTVNRVRTGVSTTLQSVLGSATPLSITDSDLADYSQPGRTQLTFAAANASLGGISAGTHSGGASLSITNGSTWVASGTPAQINSLLADPALSVQSTTAGAASLTLTLNDGSNTVGSTSSTVLAFQSISDPLLNNSASTGATARALTSRLEEGLGFLSITDPDAGTSPQGFTLTVSDPNNAFNFLGLKDQDPATAGIQLQGTAAQINAALAAGRFKSLADGTPTLELSLSNGLAPAVTSTVYVNATNAAPTLSQVNPLGNATEDLARKITFAELQGASNASDSGGSVTGFLVTSVDSTKGSLSIGGSPWNVAANNRIDAATAAVWTPAADLNGTGNDALAAFEIKAVDDGGLVSASALSVKINVAAVNDAPVLSGVPGGSVAINTSESTALVPLTVSDVDNSTLSVTLSASNGTLGNLTDADSNRSGIQLNGSAGAINTALAGATFTAATDGPAAILISVEDGSPNPTLGEYNFSATTPNSAPTLSSQSAPEPVTTGLGDNLGYITVSDPDVGQKLTLSLSASGGSIKGLGDADPNVAGIQVSGTVSAINAALANASFVAGADGAASISVSADDGVASAVTNTYNINATNAAPTLTQVSALNGATEDLAKKITFAELQAASDASDAGGSVTGFAVTSVDSTKGSLSIGGAAWNAATNNRIDADTVAVWTPAANLNGTGNDAITAFEVKALDDGGLSSATALAVKINVAAVNDAPVLTGVPGGSVPVNTGETNPLAALTVSDLDNGTLSVTLSAINGTMGNLPDADSNRSGVQLNGTASAINTALAGATFTAATDGAAGIQISVEDGSPAPTIGRYDFSATTPNSAPTLSSQGSPRPVTTGFADSLGYITVADSDIGQKLTVSLTPTGGSIRGLGDANPNAAGIQVSGTVSAINAALASASFVAAADGAASISVSADDRVASAVTNTYNINATNAAPTLTQVSALNGATEDLARRITFAQLQAASDASDAGGSVIGFEVTAVDGTKGSLSIGGNPWNAINNNRIDLDAVAVWTPVADLNGVGNDAIAAFEAKAVDDGGLRSATALVVKVNVAAVNDAPTLTGSYAFADTTEDAPTAAVRVSSLLNGSSPTRSAADKSGETASAALGLALTGKTGLGNWQFSTDATVSSGTVWQSVGNVSDQNALLLGPDTWVRYQPDATNTSASGEIAIGITYRSWDGSEGVAGTRVDTSINGDSSGFSSTTLMATLNVGAVDDPLSLTLSRATTTTNNVTAAALTYQELDSDANGVNDDLVLDGSLTLRDPDTVQTRTGAKVLINSGFQSAEDRLFVQNPTTVTSTNGTPTAGTVVISGATITFDYNVSTGVLSLTSTAVSQDVYQEALRRVTYRNISDTPTAGVREIEMLADNMFVRRDSNGLPHFYEVVAASDPRVNQGSTISWSGARNAAQNLYYAGMQGYLATVTSAEESAFLTTRLLNDSWIGASDATTDGDWKWVTGPEAGTSFWSGAINGSAVNSAYANWGSGEPNNYGGDEDYAQMLGASSSTPGKWNDLGDTNGRQYFVVEYSNTSVTDVTFSKSFTVAVSAGNDAPVLSGATPTLTSLNEDATQNGGQLISSIVNSNTITDADGTDPLGGIAITALTSRNGRWEYLLNNSGSWVAMGAVSNANSLLLGPTDAVRFVPDGKNATSAIFTYRAWDQSSGTAGTTANTATRGGSTPFSTVSKTASISVTAVNDAPFFTQTSSQSLGTVTGGDTTNIGYSVSSLVGDAGDPDSGASTAGIALVSAVETSNNTDIGDWEFSTNNGSTWSPLTGINETAAKLLAPGSSATTARIRFNPSGAVGGEASIAFRLWDGTTGTSGTSVNPGTGGGSTAYSTDSRTFTVQSTGITLSGANNTVSLTEGQAIAPGSALTLTAGTLNSARVMVASGFTAGDVLSYTPLANNPVTASYDSGTGELILSGGFSSSHYQAALQAVQFSVGDDPTQFSAKRQIAYLLDNQTSSTAFTTVTITAVADQPQLSAAQVVSYAEGGAAVALHPNLTINDADDTRIASAVVVVGGGRLLTDLLEMGSSLGLPISATAYSSSTGVLRLSGIASLADYQTALRSVTFRNTGSNPTDSGNSVTRTITMAVTDANSDGLGAADSSSISVTVNISAVNVAPVLSAGGQTSYTEGGAPVALDSGITVSDADDSNLSGTVLEISGGYTAGDSLSLPASVVAATGISSSFDATAGRLTLSGTGSVANYQTALRAVVFSSSSTDPTFSAASRTVSINVIDANRDGGGVVSGRSSSTLATSTLTLIPVADAPVVSVGNASIPTYTEADAPVAITPNLSLSDADDTQLSKAVASISSGLSSGDLLGFTPVNGISGRFDEASGSLIFTGTASVADYQTLLRSVTFSSSSSTLPNSSPRTLNIRVLDANSDGLTPQWSTVATAALNVLGVNQAPILGGAAGAVAYTENDPEIQAHAQIALSDGDSSQLSGATVTITAGLTAGDLLSLPAAIATSTGITAAYNSSTGVLSLSGDASLGAYQQALRAVTYSSSSDTPTALSSGRTLSWQVTDKDANTPAASLVLTSTINLTSVNDTPTLTDFSGPLATGGEDNEIILTYADLVGNTGNKAQVADADGTVSSLQVAKLLSGSLRIGGSAATSTPYVAGSNDVLNAGTNAYWTPAPHANGTALNAFAVVARDQSGGLVSIQPRTVRVDVTPDQADAASISGIVLPANGTYVTGQALDFTVTFDRAVTVNTSNGVPSLPITLNSGGATAALYSSGTGTNTLSFRYTVGVGDLDGDGLSLGSSLSLNNGAITSMDDGQAVNAVLNLTGIGSTAGLRVDGVNDAPLIGGAGAAISYLENDPETRANGQIALSDSDSAQLSGATVTISAGLTAGDVLALPASVATSTGITASYNSSTGVLSLSGDASLGAYQQALRAVTFSSNSDTPTASSATRTLNWQVTDKDANTPAASLVLTSTINLTSVNDTPTLTDFSGSLATGGEDTEITLTYADLIGNTGNKAQVADADGTVSSLQVTKLLSGSLRIGSSAVTATAYVAGSNDVLNASTNAYWTPAANANGSALNAFAVVAREDSGGLVSIQPRSVQAAVTPDHADAASITSLALPANDTYVLGQTLDFTVIFDRAVTVDMTSGTPSLPLSLNSGGVRAATYRAGSGTDTLSFRYTVGVGDLDLDGLSLGSALSLNNGTITSIDDSQPVNAGLSLPGIGSTAGLRVDGVNDAPVLGGTPAAVSYGENDPETAANGQLTLSDSDSAQLSGATVTISAGFTAGDLLALPTAVTTSTGITASYNSSTGVLRLHGDATLGNYQQALRAVTFSSSSDTPTAASASRTLSWQVTDKDANTPATSAVVTSTLTLSAVNDNPTLTGFSAPVATGAEDSAVEISLAALLAAGNEADVDGQVTDFVVQAVSSGSLRLGSSAATATDWAVGSNRLIDANTKAFWTPAANANGSGANALQAFTLLARDNSGTLSANPVTVKVNVTPVADAARITALNLPGNGTYAADDTLKFTLTLDRDVTLDRSGGTPKLTLALNSGVSVSADLLGQKATYTTGETLDFAYKVQRGDLSAGGLSLPASLDLPAGSSLTNTDDGFTVPVDLSLPRLDGTGVRIDGISPTLVSIEAAPGNRPNGETQSFRVTFSEPVRNVDASQFKLVPSGTASGRVSGVQAVNPVNGSAASYDLLVADIAGAGVLRFELRSSGSAIRDAYGNPFAAVSNDGRDLAVDRETPPAPAIGSVGGDDRLSDGEATDSGGVRISGTVTGVEAGQILTLTVSGSTVSTTAVVGQAGAWTAVFTTNQVSQLGNATHTLQATVSDAAGNAAPVGTRTFRIDREAPSLSNPTADPTRNPTLADSFLSLSEASNALTIRGSTSAEDGQQLDVRLGGRSQSAVIQNGNWQVEFSPSDLATLENGDLPLNLRISDVAGNLTNAGYNIVLDRTAQVNLAPISKDGWINIAESTEGLTLSGLVGNVEDGQTINVLVGARANSPTTPYTAQVFNGEFTLTVPAGDLAWNDGVTYEIAVSGQDRAGNPFSASRKVTADLTAPTLDLKLVIGDAAPVALSQYTGTLNAEAIATGVSIGSAGSSDATLTSVSVGATEGLLVAPKQTGRGTTWSIPLDPVRTNLAPEGTVSVSASAIDAAGNTSSASANIKVDRAASISIDTPVDGVGGNNQINAAEAPALTLGGSVAHVQNGVRVNVTVQQGDRTVLNTTTTVNNGLWSVSTDGSAWADGTYTVGARLVDSFGNPAATSQKIQKNTAPPVFVKTAIAGDNVLNAAEAAAAVAPSLAGFTTNAEDGQLVSVTLPGAGSAAGRALTAAVEGGIWSVPLPADLLAAYAANNGAFTANLSLSNLAGNTANSTLNFRVDTQTPTLTLNPISAAQAGTAALNPNTDTLSLSGTVLGLENEANQPVRLVVNGSELTATRESGNPSNWSLSLPKEVLKSLQATGNDVEIQVKDLADNLTSLMASFNATGVGTTPPVIAIPADRKVLADGADVLIRQFQANKTVSWRLTGIDDNLVRINPSTGSLSFLKPVERVQSNSAESEAPTLTLPFTVIATDARGNEKREALTLIVSNLVDPSKLDPLDRDGISATVEDAATNGRAGTVAGDLNNDGIADRMQPNVAAVPWINQANFDAANADPTKAEPNSFASLQVGSGVRIANLDVRAPMDVAVPGNSSSKLPTQITTSTLGEGGPRLATITTPYDPLLFQLQSYDVLTQEALGAFVDIAPNVPGTQVRMSVDLPGDGLAINTYLKWNPTANNGAGSWMEFLADGNPDTFDNGAELVDLNADGRIDRIVLTYTDGEAAGGDMDGLVNGIIDDPGMPVLLKAAQSNGQSTTSVPVVTATGTRDVPVSFYGGQLSPATSVKRESVEQITNQTARDSLSTAGVTLNKDAIDFEITLNPGFKEAGLKEASVNTELSLVGSDLTLKDAQGRRLANRRLALYGTSATGTLQALAYNPVKKAGARFYDLDDDKVAEFLSLSLLDGDYGDKGMTVDGEIAAGMTAATVDLDPKLTPNAATKTWTVADPGNPTAPASVVVRATLNSRAGSANQIGYVVLEANEIGKEDELLADLTTLKSRAKTAFSNFEGSDVTLPTGARFESDIVLQNGQGIRFFEVADATLEEISKPGDSRFKFLETTDTRLSLTFPEGDQGLNELISREQGTAPVLDFSAFSESDTIKATVGIAREAGFNPIAGFYRALDAQGSVRAADGSILRPGDGGYAAAALRTDNLVTELAGFQVGNRQVSITEIAISESTVLAPFARVNSDTFFAYGAANADGLSHFRSFGKNLIGLEDTRGGGDRDYDDLILQFSFSKGSVS